MNNVEFPMITARATTIGHAHVRLMGRGFMHYVMQQNGNHVFVQKYPQYQRSPITVRKGCAEWRMVVAAAIFGVQEVDA